MPPRAHGVQVMSTDFFVSENRAMVWRGPMLGKTIPASDRSHVLGGRDACARADRHSRRRASRCPGRRAQLYQTIGRQSRPWMLGTLGLLLLTGAGNLWTMGVPLSLLADPAYYATPFGHTLGVKLGFVLVIVVITLVHDAAMTRLGPSRAAGGAATPGEAARYRALGRWIGHLNLVLGLIVVWLGLRLVAG